MEPADQKDYDHYLEVVRKQLERSVFENAWAEGRRMTLDQVVEFALEQTDE